VPREYRAVWPGEHADRVGRRHPRVPGARSAGRTRAHCANTRTRGAFTRRPVELGPGARPGAAARRPRTREPARALAPGRTAGARRSRHGERVNPRPEDEAQHFIAVALRSLTRV